MKKKPWFVAAAVLSIIAVILVGVLVLKVGPGRQADQVQDRAAPYVHGAVPDAPSPAPGEESDIAAEPPTIEITPDMQRMLGIKTVAAALAPLTRTIRLTGRIEYNEQRLFTVNTKVEGWVEKLYVDYTGRYLKKGEPILELYSPELLAAQQELINLSAWRIPGGTSTEAMISTDLERLRDAARQRLRLWDISNDQIGKIEQTLTPLRTLTISSPVSGYVARRGVTRGMRVMAGEALLDIADISEVWIMAEVSESDAGLVRVGQPVKITVTGLPDTVYATSIDYVYPSLTPETRTLKVRGTLKNPDGILKPAMLATAAIPLDLGVRLSVPEEAVMDTGTRQVVYVDRGDGLFEPRVVTAGLRADNKREILGGLGSGERVAAAALFMLDSEAQLKGVTPLAPPAHRH